MNTQLSVARHQAASAISQLEQAVQAALETYSNVHRGSGQHSLVSTHLYEQAREIVLEHLGLNKAEYTVIFCTPRRAAALEKWLVPGTYECLSSQDVGLPLGVRAFAVLKKKLPRGAIFETGGGTARLVGPGWVVWGRAPDKFEAGTPAIVNVVALAKALRLLPQFGKNAFQDLPSSPLSASDVVRRDDLEAFSGQELLDRLKQTLIGRGAQVPTMEGTRPYVNLDNGASTPTFAPIWTAVRQAWALPKDSHEELLRHVRGICAETLGAPETDYDVIFTSNTTEAINLVAANLRNNDDHDHETVVLNTLLEHNSNELPWRTSAGLSLIRMPVDAEGFLDLKELEALLSAYNERGDHGRKRIQLVAVTGASNVLGVFNDLGEISRIAHRCGARVLIDAAQMVAHRQVEMKAWDIDYLAFSGHKAYAPFGSGALLARRELWRLSSAELKAACSSGEENVGGIAALGKALLLLQRIGFEVLQNEERALTVRLLRGLAQVPDVTVYGIKDTDSPRFAHKGGVVVFALNRMMASGVAKELAERGGVGIRFGCHCAHLIVKQLLGIRPFLERFQRVIVTLFPRLALPGVARVSLGLQNSEEDVDTMLRVLGAIAQRTPVKGPSPKNVRKQIAEYVKGRAQRVYEGRDE